MTLRGGHRDDKKDVHSLHSVTYLCPDVTGLGRPEESQTGSQDPDIRLPNSIPHPSDPDHLPGEPPTWVLLTRRLSTCLGPPVLKEG